MLMLLITFICVDILNERGRGRGGIGVGGGGEITLHLAACQARNCIFDYLKEINCFGKL